MQIKRPGMNGFYTPGSHKTLHTQQQDTPFEVLVFGYQTTLLSALTNSPNPIYCYDDYAKELIKERLIESLENI